MSQPTQAQYTVGYVDEDEIDRNRFQRIAKGIFKVIALHPDPDLDQFTNYLLALNLDALILDFKFSEQDPKIRYTGEVLLKKFQQEREDFPLFILTSFNQDAMNDSDDVNLIYEKSEMSKAVLGKTKFLEKIKKQIRNYQDKKEKIENRILQLMEIWKQSALTPKEAEELVELNHKMERMIGGNPHTTPRSLNHAVVNQQLGQLLTKLDEVLKKMK